MTSELRGHAAHSAKAQERAIAHMDEIGVTPEFVDALVDRFYLRIQQHKTLGAVFNNHIQEHWPQHMARMKLFWRALAFKTGSYDGRPVQAHLAVKDIGPELFPLWLQLFRDTLEEMNASIEAKEWFFQTAERIAKSLTLSLFYNPAMDDPHRPKQ